MADPSSPPAGASPTPNPATSATYKAPSEQNRALRMMGLPNLPKKLPSRNWMIFWTLSASLAGAIIYDKREKKRATAKWARVVAPLATEPIPSPNQIPRRLTIYLESPPNDGLRVAQDHFTEYIKPVLAASGLDWEFVQGRMQGDVRAAVAERIRRTREPPSSTTTAEGGAADPAAAAAAAAEKTTDELIQEIRKRNQTPEWTGIQGDIIVGRHTWKEYVRGLHEGWLGPVTPPAALETKKIPETTDAAAATSEEEKKPAEEEKKKPERPPQPAPYNTTADYPSAVVPASIPDEFSPSIAIQFPHLLGFLNTPVRMYRFLTRRHLADDIGREVAAVCFAAAREYRPASGGGDDDRPEQATVLEHEERNWHKDVWKAPEPEKKEGEAGSSSDADDASPTTTSDAAPAEKKKELVCVDPVVLDERVAGRMRRFELAPEHDATAAAVKVPEEELEGFLKGGLRSLYRWAVADPVPNPRSSSNDD